MSPEEKIIAFRSGDGTTEAIAMRLKTARLAAGYRKQVDLANALRVSKTTYGHQEKNGRPPVSTMRFLYVNHRIDYNFILNGDFAQLPGDVQISLQKAHHDQTQSVD